MENNLEISYDKLIIDGRSYDETDSKLFPLEIDVDESVGCLELHSDNYCSSLDDCPWLYWSYAGGPGFVVKVEETSTAAIEKSRPFQCTLPEVHRIPLIKKNKLIIFCLICIC